MKKNNMRIKENITIFDQANAIEKIVSSCFTNNIYTPYYRNRGEVIAIIMNFIDGVEFEEKEDVYNAYLEDDELQNLVINTKHATDWQFIEAMVDDKLAFMKDVIVHSHPDLDKIVNAANVIIDSLENFSKLKIADLSEENIKDAVTVIHRLADSGIELNQDTITTIVKDAANFDLGKAAEEIIDEKNKQLREKDKQIANFKKYKDLHDARNVVSDNNH